MVLTIKPIVGLGLSPTTTKRLVADRRTAAWDYGQPLVLSVGGGWWCTPIIVLLPTVSCLSELELELSVGF